MIQPNQEQRLGRTAFLILLSKKTTPSFFLFLITAVLIGLNNLIVRYVSIAVNMGGARLSISSLATYLTGIELGLLLLSIILFLLGLIVARLMYTNYTFTFQEFGLKLRRGVLDIKEISIPFRQMQDVNIDRSLFDRFLGVSKVIIDSAGHEEKEEKNETDIILEPIEKDMAEEILRLLQRKIGVQIVKDEKVADADNDKV